MKSANITDLVEFNDTASLITKEELPYIQLRGSTAIETPIVLLSQTIKKRDHKNIPKAIILITDQEENRAPYLNDVLKLIDLINYPPIVILHCRS